MTAATFSQEILPMKDMLFRYAYNFVQQRQEAEDVVQEIMIRLWHKREEWHTVENPGGYCMTMVRNLCLDRIKKKKVPLRELDGEVGLPAAEQDPFEKTAGRETLTHLHRLIQSLPEKLQQVLQLREIEGHSYQEIAQMLDISMDQVKVNLFRARNVIKQTFLKTQAHGVPGN